MADTRPPLIYLDYQATTPCDSRVINGMMPYFERHYGNPHSRNHPFGWQAEEACEQARERVAQGIKADPKEIIFTSGATEANNLALQGLARFYGDKKRHIVTVQTEHKCILDTCRHLEQEGFTVTYLSVNKEGLIDLDDLKHSLREDTLVVSVMAVNNEIGVIQPIKEIGALTRARSIFFHCDAAQALGKIPLDVEACHIDLMSLSSHKIYGPKGVGALYVRRKPRVRLAPLFHGGGQERGMRSGTLSPALCVGFGDAVHIAVDEMDQENIRLKMLRERFLNLIFSNLKEVYLNGHPTQGIPGNINLSFAHVEGEGLMMGIKNLAVSSGSACTSASLEPSYVLRALGVGDELAHSSLRIGFGRMTTLEEVDSAAAQIIAAVTRLRHMSPLWEMAQEGIDIKTVKWASH